MLLDSGNFSDNPTPEGEIKTRAVIEAMGRLGYAASGVGERDLNLGYDEFEKKAKGSSVQFLSTNIVRKDTKEPVFKPWLVVESKRGSGKPPVRVGVLAVTRFNPIFLKAGPQGTNLAIAPPVEMLQKYIGEVRGHADVVVLLAALGRDDARQIAQQVPGIDFVFGAFGGVYSPREEFEGSTRLLYSGNQGKRVGEARVFLDGKGRMTSDESFLYSLSGRYPDDPDMLAFVAGALSKLKEGKGGGKGATRPDAVTAPSTPLAR